MRVALRYLTHWDYQRRSDSRPSDQGGVGPAASTDSGNDYLGVWSGPTWLSVEDSAEKLGLPNLLLRKQLICPRAMGSSVRTSFASCSLLVAV